MLRGLAALITLLVLLAGLPLLLYRLGGSPVPAHVAAPGQIWRALLRRDNGWLFLAAVRDVSWLAWAAFTAAVIAEVQATLRGRNAPRMRLGGLQAAAGRLVALTMLTFGAPSTAMLALPQAIPVAAVAILPASAGASLAAAGAQPASPGAQPAAATASLAPADARAAAAGASLGAAGASLDAAVAQPAGLPPAGMLSPPAGDLPGPRPPDQATVPPVTQGMSMGFYQLVTVHPGDCLWTIAQHYLGDGDLYPEIVKLNLGHAMGRGQVFSDPSVIWPGWMLQLPASGAAAGSPPRQAGSNGHAAHPSREHRFRRPHPSARAGAGPAGPAASPAAPASTPANSARPAAPPASGTGPAPASVPAGSASSAASSGMSATAGQPQAAGEGTQRQEIPPFAVFAAGMLAGGAAVTLARMRHRQRQSRRPGRRIPLPASAPVIAAEQRLRAQTGADPAMLPPTALRAALSELGAWLVAAGQQVPDITGIRLLPSGMEVLLASPANEPPPPPFTVPGGRQGKAWLLSLPDDAPAEPFQPAETGDLLPGLLTAGAVDGGYLLIDLEHLRVTTVDGPPGMTDQVLASAAAELATSELAGWYDLILVGFGELDGVGSRATSCLSFEEALDLLAAKAVALRRSLGDDDLTDIRDRRLADPGNEDWALALLVSRYPPTSGQLALLLDLAADPGGVAALVPGGAAVPDGYLAPASMRLAADPGQPGGIVADIMPLQVRAWPQLLDEFDYMALASMFATAAGDGDVAADAPPYDGSSWPVPLGSPAVLELADDELAAGWEAEAPAAGWEAEAPAAGWEAEASAASLPDPDQAAEQAEYQAAEHVEYQAAEHVEYQAAEQVADPAAEQPADSDAGQPSLRIGILGTLTINGTPGALLPAQSQLVLALAVSGQSGLSNRQLCYLLGADPDHPKPTDSLRQLIVRTRRQLGRAADGREWIEHLGAGQYALHPDSRFDWHEFEALTAEGMRSRDAGRLRDALRLIRGQPFTGCYHWSLDLALIETVRAQIVDAAQMLAGLELAAGDWAAAARAARTGLAGDSGAEQLWRALMRAEHAAGNLTGVREAWSRCLDEIAEIAADGEPHPETAALYHQLVDTSRPWPAWSRN
jgi:DNA-binding SARP family transcriptional activator